MITPILSAVSVLRVINFSRANATELHLARDHPFFVDGAHDVSDEKWAQRGQLFIIVTLAFSRVYYSVYAK